MDPITTVVCAWCQCRVHVSDMDDTKRCSTCRAKHVLKRSRDRQVDGDGTPLGADAGVYIEELHQPNAHALLDQRAFDGGAHLHECDEI
jgi:hypothetical protein